jgi:hypothetical protein
LNHRNLKYAGKFYFALDKNIQHKFANQHALMIYKSDSIYTFIPKNACSTMRLSLAIANGCIKDVKDFNWIHKNNATFVATLKDLIKAKYTFVILRDPFRRLASVYLDKIVDRTMEAWNLYDLINREIKLEKITFKRFIKIIEEKKLLRSNIHWRPQIDFLVYEKYDDYFALENFSKAIPEIEKKAKIKIYDARNLTKHGLDQYKLIKDKDFSNVSPVEIFNLKQKGFAPSYETLYDKELIEMVRNLYKEDFELYIEKFGKDKILFKESV